MKHLKIFIHSMISIIPFLGLGYDASPLLAAESVVFDSNPMVAELENQPVRLEDLRNKKIYDLSLQLYQQLQEQLILHTLENLENKHKEINSKPRISISEEQILAVYEGNNLKERGSLDKFRPQIRQYLKAQLRQEMLLNQFGMALEKGWVKSYLSPPSEFTQEASIKTAYIRGNPKAKVMILEFSDYQCPYCSRIQGTVQKLIKTYEKKIAFGYRHFPLGFHTEADDAAMAVECAREQGKFEEMHELLYANQKAQFPEDLKKYSRRIGIKNKKKFDQCLESEQYRGLVNQDMEDGASLGISGTPGFFIGRYNPDKRRIKGELLSGAQPLNAFENLIAKYLTQP